MTLRWVADLKTLDFDIRSYKSELDRFLKEETKDAARSWLRTVLVIIPTWSRASRATFEALANEVGFNVTYGPQRSREDRLILGLKTGRGGLEIKAFKSYHFFYESDLKYLAYNNQNFATPGPAPQPFGKLRNPTPYKFTDAGKNDFESRSFGIRLPSPLQFITGKRI